MSIDIPDDVRDTIREELEADTEDYRERVPEGTWTKPNQSTSALLTVRITPQMLHELQARAAANAESVSTVVRGFIHDGLSAPQDDDLRSALESLEQDVARVRARVLSR